MVHPVRPHVILGDKSMNYMPGDLVDANQIEELNQASIQRDEQEASSRAAGDKKI